LVIPLWSEKSAARIPDSKAQEEQIRAFKDSDKVVNGSEISSLDRKLTLRPVL
jgi:hypothetical protein